MKTLRFMPVFLLLTMTCFAQTWTWAKSGDGTGANEGWGATCDLNGNVFIVGEFTGPVITFGSYSLTNAGSMDVYVVKYDANGNVVWARRAGGTAPDLGTSIYADPSGNIIITGNFDSPNIIFGTFTLTNSGGSDLFIVKYDTNGNVLWAQTAIGTGTERGYGVSTDSGGNIFVTGNFNSPTVAFGTSTLTNSGAFDLFIAKYDSSGNPLWARSAGGQYIEAGYSVCNDVTGNSFITGYFCSSTIAFGTYTLTNADITLPYSEEIYLTKYDPNGNVLWAVRSGGVNTEKGNSICTDNSGNVFLTGSFASPSIALGSFTLTDSNAPNADAFVCKYSGSGNAVWAKNITGSGQDVGYSVAIYSTTAFVVGSMGSGTGGSSVTADSYSLTAPPGSTDPLFLVKYDLNGNAIYATAIASGGDDICWICTDQTGSAYISGDFTCNSFVLGTNTLALTGTENIFVAKFSNQIDLGIRSQDKIIAADIFPNPNSGSFKVQIDNDINNCELILFNSTGQKIHEQKIIRGSNNINIPGLANGLYNFILLSDKQRIKEGKLAVE